MYSYSVYYEAAPEGGYVAFVPALPGCHTQGETLEEAERNVKEAIELYLESLTAHPRTVRSGEAILRCDRDAVERIGHPLRARAPNQYQWESR